VDVATKQTRARLMKVRVTSGCIACNRSRAWINVVATGRGAVRSRCPIRRTIVLASRATARVVAISWR